jgi:streptogramin lyase
MKKHSVRFELILAALVVIGAVVAGCSHGTIPVLPRPGSAPLPQTAKAVLTIKWPSPTPAPAIAPKFLSPSTQSVAVSVNGGAPQVANRPSPPASTTSMTIDAPVGTDTFTFGAFDQFNGSGSLLGVTTVTQQIVAGQANVITATLNGVIDHIVLALPNPTPTAGTAVGQTLSVMAFDADNNVIVGPGGYDRTITLSDSDGSGVTSLNHTTVTGPGAPTVTMSYNGGNVWSATFDATAMGIAPGKITTATFQPKPKITEYAVPVPSFSPPPVIARAFEIVSGPDGKLWFTQPAFGQINNITTGGVFGPGFPLPNPTSSPLPEPADITVGPDGKLWFTDIMRGEVGSVTTGGAFAEFPVPSATSSTAPFPVGIAVGADGNIWFSEEVSNGIGSISTGGIFTPNPEFTLPSTPAPLLMAQGPDRAIWFPEQLGNKIGRLDDFFVLKEFPIPTASARPSDIVVGSDGALWFTETGTDKIGRITTTGTITEFAVTAGSQPLGIVAGPDGALWFAELQNSAIGRITTSGSLTEIPVTLNSEPALLAVGADGNIWFTEAQANKIAKLQF